MERRGPWWAALLALCLAAHAAAQSGATEDLRVDASGPEVVVRCTTTVRGMLGREVAFECQLYEGERALPGGRKLYRALPSSEEAVWRDDAYRLAKEPLQVDLSPGPHSLTAAVAIRDGVSGRLLGRQQVDFVLTVPEGRGGAAEGAAPPAGAPAPPEGGFTPGRALVFAVGVIAFQDAQSFSAYPQEGRRDAELVDWFRRQGASRVTFLQDGQATLARIREAFRALLAASQPGDLLVVYYTGHGAREQARGTYFVPYDGRGGAAATTGWGAAEVVECIEQGFRGDRALLLADCCYSGALAVEADRRAARVSIAALTSSQASSPSTGSWAFTECVLAGLRGDPRVDLDGDGRILLGELGRYAESELAFAEGQLSSFREAPRLPASTLLGAASGPRAHPLVGAHVEVLWQGRWYPATVLRVDGARRFVTYAGYRSGWDAWVDQEAVRPWQAPAHLPPGTAVEVEWRGTWYPACVKDARLGLHLIHYDGYSEDWDEWVGPGRIRR